MPIYPNERLIERALKLIVQMEVEPPGEAKKAQEILSAWRVKTPEHEAAVIEAQQRWSMLGGMAEQLRGRFDVPPTKPENDTHRQTRRSLLSLFVIGGTTALAGNAFWNWLMPTRYGTQTAELLTIHLSDAGDNTLLGSTLDLNAQTSVAVALQHDRRTIKLGRGEIRCEVIRDANRPFSVTTREGVVEVIGTVFSVVDRGGPISVAVERGHVRFTPSIDDAKSMLTQTISPIDLHAGDVLTIEHGHVTIRQHSDVESLTAWREGWLVFDNTPLSVALPAINAYRARPIFITDRQIGDLRVTGRFRAKDSATLLAALPSILPLRRKDHPDGSVELLNRVPFGLELSK